MDNSLLRQLVSQGESEQVEFKSGLDEKSHVEEAACAFLNGRGGVILAGVGDKGEVTGVESAERQTKAVQKRLADTISPPTSLSVSVGELDGKHVVVIDVPQGLEKPYVCHGRIMVRRGAHVIPASASEVSALIGQRVRTEGRWERLPALGAEEADFDSALILKVAQTIREARGHGVGSTKKVAKVLEQLGLYRQGQYTNAAVVLFGKNPADRYPQTRVRAARFKGDDRAEFADNRVFEGNVFELVDTLTKFLADHIPVTSSLDTAGFQRRDRPAFPWAAIREAVVNALVHRDYAAFDGGMSVAVFDDRVDVWNSGRLPDEMTVEDLKTTHPSRPANPDIAQVCFLYGLMERWGIGTQRIVRACVEGGLPEPEWRVDGNGVTLTMRLAEPVPAAHGVTSTLNLRQLVAVQRLRPGEQVRLPDYLKLVSGEVKDRQARTDLNQLAETGYLRRVGAGPATAYVRTKKPVEEVPAVQPSARG